MLPCDAFTARRTARTSPGSHRAFRFARSDDATIVNQFHGYLLALEHVGASKPVGGIAPGRCGCASRVGASVRQNGEQGDRQPRSVWGLVEGGYSVSRLVPPVAVDEKPLLEHRRSIDWRGSEQRIGLASGLRW